MGVFVRQNGEVLTIVEAKPFHMTENPGATLMQTVLEMMAHILDC